MSEVKESLKMANISALLLLTFASLVFAEEQKEMEVEDPFTFDYHRLRVGGLILAAVLCLIGITILFSGHCRCKFNQDKRRRSGSNAAQPLNDQVETLNLESPVLTSESKSKSPMVESQVPMAEVLVPVLEALSKCSTRASEC